MKNREDKIKWKIFLSASLIVICFAVVMGSLGIVENTAGCGNENELNESDQYFNNGKSSKEIDTSNIFSSIEQEGYAGDLCSDIITDSSYKQNETDTSPHLLKTKKIKPSKNIYDRIRIEATLPNSDSHYPLPLFSSWNASTWWNYSNPSDDGFSPDLQIDVISDKNYIFPAWLMPTLDGTHECVRGANRTTSQKLAYYDYKGQNTRSAIERAKALKLPISFIGEQWECLLSEEPYKSYPIDTNPNAISATSGDLLLNNYNHPDKVQLAPFGPESQIASWYEAGKEVG